MMSDACAAMGTGEGEFWGCHDFQRLKARSRGVADHTRIRRGPTSKLAKKIAFLNQCMGSLHRLAAHCGTQADQLQPITRCDDLAGGTAKVPNSS